MSGKDRYLIDTNILIYFLEGEKVAVSFFKKIIDDDIYISLINKIEVLSFPDLSEKEEVSRNEKDFIRVNELKFLNPYQA